MVRKTKLIIAVFSVICLSCLGREAFAGVLLVEGDIDSFHIVAQTKYLGKKPVLLFTGQQNLNVEVLFKVNNFLFKDSSWEDLALRLSQAERIVAGEEARLNIKRPGRYEFYFLSKDLSPDDFDYEIEVDGRKIPCVVPCDELTRGRKYVMLADVELSPGQHRIKVIIKVAAKALEKTPSETIPQPDVQVYRKISLLLVNRQEAEQMRKVVWGRVNNPRTEVAYAFEVDKGEFWVKEINPKREGSQYTLKLMLLPADADIKTNAEQSAPVLPDKGDIPLVKIDNQDINLRDLEIKQDNVEPAKGRVVVKRLFLKEGEHRYEKLENGTFRIAWLIVEPIGEPAEDTAKNIPQVTFTMVNPTKYLVKVENAKEAFWLVFSQMFHEGWRLYALPAPENPSRFPLADLKFLFKAPLEAGHYQVNAYANGWYVEPKKLNLGENFILVIYYWPQSFFYLGFIFSGIGLAVSLVSLVIIKCRKKSF
jgi:hypothetical protein